LQISLQVLSEDSPRPVVQHWLLVVSTWKDQENEWLGMKTQQEVVLLANTLTVT
jgi:hypothetical protein